MITSDDIRRSLVGTALPSGPDDIALPPGSALWPESFREKMTGALTPAGVLIPIMDRGRSLSVLLTQRSAELKHHAGQVSFPGGSMEAVDDDLEATALRETEEEVGIGSSLISVLGYLGTMPTISGYAVTPVVASVSAEAELRIDKSEVEYAFEVPLAFLLDARNDIVRERDTGTHRIPMIEFHWEGERIWGATALMILALRNRLLNQ